MKLLCSPYCSNEYSIDADLLLLEVKPDDAVKLLKAMERSRKFLREMVGAGLADRPHGHVAFPSPIHTRLFGNLPEELEATLDHMVEEDWLVMSGDSRSLAKQLKEASEAELEFHYLMIYEKSVFISALSRYGDDRFECRGLTRTMIEEIAQGRQPTNAAIINGGTPYGLRVDV